MKILFALLTFVVGVSSTILSDTGCSCATTTAAANGTGPLGCSSKLDWTGQVSKWCLTAGGCGSYEPGFGVVDSCSQAGFPSFTLAPPVYLESDQSGYTYYTGQTLAVNWTSQSIAVDEWLKLNYMGASLRTLTTGQGVNVTAGNYSVRISDTATSLATAVPITITTTTASPIMANTTQLLTVLQSKIAYVNVYNNATLVTAGASFPCDNRNLTIQWRGLGEASVGVATVTIKSSFGGGGGGGGGTTVGTPMILLATQGNLTVNYTLPRSFVPSGFGGTTYTAQISVQSPGTGVTPYTLSSLTFGLTAAPTVTPTATPTTTPTKTPTPSLSFGSTASTTPSNSISMTPTPTPSLSTGATPSNTPTISVTASPSASQSSSSSQTDTITPTASQTGTITPSSTTPPDLAAISRAAAEESSKSVAITIGATIGGIVFVAMASALGYRTYTRRLLHDQRKRRLNTITSRVNERASVYGIQTEITPQQQQYTNARVYRSNSARRGMSSV